MPEEINIDQRLVEIVQGCVEQLDKVAEMPDSPEKDHIIFMNNWMIRYATQMAEDRARRYGNEQRD